MTYEDFKKDWLSRIDKSDENGIIVSDELLEYFCQCDYKRYTGEWKVTL